MTLTSARTGLQMRSLIKPNLARSNLAQGSDTRLVAALDLWRVALAQHARPVRGGENQLETVRDLLQAVYNGNAGHGLPGD